MNVTVGNRKARYASDNVGYSESDSGCWVASQYLGRPSQCLNCPFPHCIIDHVKSGRPYEAAIKEAIGKRNTAR